jgi:hypothetical protein
LDHLGNRVHLQLNLVHSPSEGSYVSTAEAVAWHILKRADHFMRRSDLSLEALSAMLFAACSTYNASPTSYRWGHGSPYELWHLDRMSMLHFLFAPGTLVCFLGPSGTDCGIYLMPGDSRLHIVYELRSRSLTLVTTPTRASTFLSSSLRSIADPDSCFGYPVASPCAAPALGIPILVDSQLALAPTCWIEARMLEFSRATPPRLRWRAREDGGVACSELGNGLPPQAPVVVNPLIPAPTHRA